MNYRRYFTMVFFITMLSITGFVVATLLTTPMGCEEMCAEFDDAGE